jgi:cell division septum initiation protein DivIVA
MPKGITYSQEEVDNFLDELEEILPATATGWERVAEIHLSRYPDQQHSVDSLKRKFKELHKKENSYRRPCLPTSHSPSQAFKVFNN